MFNSRNRSTEFNYVGGFEGQLVAYDKYITVLKQVQVGCVILASVIIVAGLVWVAILASHYKDPVKGFVFADWWPVLTARILQFCAFGGGVWILRTGASLCGRCIAELLEERAGIAKQMEAASLAKSAFNTNKVVDALLKEAPGKEA